MPRVYYGIPQRDLGALWGFGTGIAALTLLLMAVRFYSPRLLQAWPALTVVYWVLFAAFVVYVLVVLFRPHPANHIFELVEAGQLEEACAAGDVMLAEWPEDQVVRWNCMVAQYRAGHKDEAGKLFESLRVQKLPGVLRREYPKWQQTFREQGAI